MDPQRDFVVTDKDAYFILPQEFICGPTIQSLAWAPDGEHLAIIREVVDLSPSMLTQAILGKEEDRASIEPENQIIVWSAVSRKTSILMRLKASRGQIHSIQWIAGSSSLVVQGSTNDPSDPSGGRTSVIILTNNGQTIPVTQFEPAKQYEVIPSPSKPIAALVEHQAQAPVAALNGNPVTRQPATIRFFGPDGKLSDPMKFPSPLCIPFWSSNGLPYVMSVERAPGATKAKRTWYLIDRSAHKIDPSTPPVDADHMFRQMDPAELTVDNLSAKLSGTKVGINAPTVVVSSTLGKDSDLTVVTTDGLGGEISPKLNAISYRSQGSLMVRQMTKVPLLAYLRAKDAATRTRLVQQAKQVALGLLMHSADYDDNLISNTGDWQSGLAPYLKDSNITNGFNYTFAGGPQSGIDSPATTILGYIEGPGGRAVAYADGHVRWIPNP